MSYHHILPASMKYGGDRDDWSVNQNIMHEIHRQSPFRLPALDLFASKRNAKADMFFTKEENAFLQEWIEGPLWINPPFNQKAIRTLLARLLDGDRHYGTIIVPDFLANFIFDHVPHMQPIIFDANTPVFHHWDDSMKLDIVLPTRWKTYAYFFDTLGTKDEGFFVGRKGWLTRQLVDHEWNTNPILQTFRFEQQLLQNFEIVPPRSEQLPELPKTEFMMPKDLYLNEDDYWDQLRTWAETGAIN